VLETRESEVWRIGEQYVLYKLDVSDGMFWLFDIQAGACFKLNETSYFILSCFDGKAPLSEVHKRILTEYAGEDSEVITGDFDWLFNTLKRRGILELVHPEGGKEE
jgi:hypothetical protein